LGFRKGLNGSFLILKHLFNISNDFLLSHLIEICIRSSGWSTTLLLNLLELLKLSLFLVFKLGDLFNDSLEDLVSRHIIELSKSGMNALGVVESNVAGAVAAENSLRLSAEYNFLDSLDVAIDTLALLAFTLLVFVSTLVSTLILKLVIHNSLLLVSLSTVVTGLHKLFDKPLDHGVDLGIIETLNLLRGESQGAVHLL
jgi:hypothetical protein